MYKILVGIAKELSNIKQIMAEEGKHIVHKYLKIFCKIFEYFCMNIVDNEVINNDAESLGVFDGDDYKTLMEMDEFKSQVSKTREITWICGQFWLLQMLKCIFVTNN